MGMWVSGALTEHTGEWEEHLCTSPEAPASESTQNRNGNCADLEQAMP